MAKKAPSKDPETGKFTKSEDIISADSAIQEERQRISDEQTTEFLGEEVKNNEVVEEVSLIEKKAEEMKAAPKEEVKEMAPEPKIDPSAIARETAEKTAKEMADKISKALTGKEEATKAEKSKYEAAAEEFENKNGRPPAWHELVPFMVDDALEKIEQRQAEKAAKENERLGQINKYNEDRSKAFNAQIDTELNDLMSSNRLPKTEDARKALFQTMLEVNTARQSEGKTPIYSLKEIFYEHYKAPNAQPAGADAPVSAGRGGTVTPGEDDYSYADIAGKKSFMDILLKR